MEEKTYITLTTLSQKTGLTKAYLQELAESKKIPSLLVNRRFRFNPEAVQGALDQLAAEGWQE